MDTVRLPQDSHPDRKIKVIRNGPYIVSGGIPLSVQTIVLDHEGLPLAWRETRRYPIQQTYALCRCGKSRTRPFCDGSHTKSGFDGTEVAGHEAYLNESESSFGPNLDLADVKPLCIHAGFCDRAGGIWNLVLHSDDLESRQIAIEEACNCPSGRLVVRNKDGTIIEPPLEPSIVLMESSDGELIGPIWVRGNIPIESAGGEKYTVRNRVTLCGCGRSSNKPFCDGTHRQKQTAD